MNIDNIEQYNIDIVQYTPKKRLPTLKFLRPPPGGRRGERQPAHTPTHINIKQN